MKGKVVSVNISTRKGEKKYNIESCRLKKDRGLENDAHEGFLHRQVSLLAKESIEKMQAKGVDVGCGDFAENLTTEGINLVSLPLGTRLAVGPGSVLRITQIGKECHSGCSIFLQAGDCIMPREGIFAEVLIEGTVSIGDKIEVLP